MNLTDELVTQFVRMTDDAPKESQEATVYGTIKQERWSGKYFVVLDGNPEDQLTPVASTANCEAGDRVIVRIKNHQATVIGNVESPSASSTQLKGVTDDLSKKVSTDLLDAERARIDDLETKTAVIEDLVVSGDAEIGNIISDNVEIRNQLNANKAAIDQLTANKLDVSVASATYATIANLEATNTKVYNLEVIHGQFEQLTAEQLDAVNADIENLQTNMMTADHAVIKELEAGIAEIDTLIFGSATGNVIQSSFANAVIAQLGDAQIKSAMIESIAADKITSGDVITNNVRVMSEDGKLVISDETMQISDENRVRVQIGKDAEGDYSISIWDQNGNLMFSKGGITDSAIKDKIIRDDMVSDTANISAHKLNIDSLFEEINGSTKTIKSTKVYLDDKKQTLDVAFKTMETDVSGLGQTVSSQGTQLTAVQGQIASKVWQQDIDTAKGEMSTQYSALEQDLGGFKTTVSETYATSQDAERAQSTAEAAQETATNAESLVQQLSHSISMLVTDGNGTSLMTQTEDGWTFSTAEIQANVADVAEGLDKLTNDLGSTSNTVGVLKQAVADLGEIAEYVKIGTYGGEPCIELGESDSEFKMRITNTRILFMEGSNIVAHISNQSLHIKKAVIEEELQQGGFVWKVRNNGNMGLVWKGVSS